MGAVGLQRALGALPALALFLSGCGDGLFTRGATAPGSAADGAAIDAGAMVDSVGGVDAATASLPTDGGIDELVVPIAADGGSSDDGNQSAIYNMPVKAGASAVGQLGDGTLTVPSMSFDQDVVLTLQAAAAPIPGPIGQVFRLEQNPIGVHSRNALHFALDLAPDQQTIAVELRLATYKDKAPTGLWVAVPKQAYDPTTHTIAADFFGLDSGPLYFGILRFCTQRSACDAIQVCSGQLCQ
ncbi:MAG TPA: hypothetical protein VGL59_25390 [Polyangia bacterium]